MPSLRKNFIYNAILTMSGYIFPLMVYPYVSRILGVSNIGACNFVDSIVEYFTIISMMGMNTIGIREIAKCKGDRKKLDRTFSQLFSLNTISTLIAVVSLILATLLISKFSDYKGLLYIGIGKLFFNYLIINWFFQGKFQVYCNQNYTYKSSVCYISFYICRYQRRYKDILFSNIFNLCRKCFG